MQRLKIISELFWFVFHFEFNVAPGQIPWTQPRPTLSSVSLLWEDLWQRIHRARVKMSHEVSLPRLRSLDVFVGLDSSFKVDLSERDDEASMGKAKVHCTELEAFISKVSSSGPLWNQEQEKIIGVLKARAESGSRTKLPTTVDSEMMRPPAFRDSFEEDRFYHR